MENDACRFKNESCTPEDECDACVEFYNENPWECECGGPGCGGNFYKLHPELDDREGI